MVHVSIIHLANQCVNIQYVVIFTTVTGEDTVLSVDAHLKPLKRAIWEARAKWPVIGRALPGISEGTMLAIHDKDDGDCLHRVLSLWIHSGKATISDLLQALADETVKRNDIKNEIHILKGKA